MKTRVWVVLDGTDLYVDTNGDGDLTAPGERFGEDGKDFKPFEIADAGGPDRYLIQRLKVDRDDGEFGAMLDIQVETKGKYRQICTPVLKRSEEGRRRDARLGILMPVLAPRPAGAPVCHFHGPQRIRLDPGRQLLTGGEPAHLFARLDTGAPPFGGLVTVRTHWMEKQGDRAVIKLFSEDAHPVAEIEFPPKNPGNAPVRRRYELKERC
jgi:hypothetical protein